MRGRSGFYWLQRGRRVADSGGL